MDIFLGELGQPVHPSGTEMAVPHSDASTTIKSTKN